jgi:hypothetical protein
MPGRATSNYRGVNLFADGLLMTELCHNSERNSFIPCIFYSDKGATIDVVDNAERAPKMWAPAHQWFSFRLWASTPVPSSEVYLVNQVGVTFNFKGFHDWTSMSQW